MLTEPIATPNDPSHSNQPAPPAQTAAPAPAHAPTFDEQYAQARTWANGGQPDLAIRAYSDLLARSPGNADVLLGRGLVYSRTGRYPEAEADLLAASGAAPSYADVWLALGDLYRRSGRPQRAVPAYDRVLALQPGDADAAAGRAAALAAQEAPATAVRAASSAAANPEALSSRFGWLASLSAGTGRVSPGDQHWNDQLASVRRYTQYGSLGVEALSASRFGRRDHAWALDAYAGLWPRAYANLRYQHAPVATLFPSTSWRAELFQGVGTGWELSASNDSLHFDQARVRIVGVGLAKYIGNFYLLYRHTDIDSTAPLGDGKGDRALVRYYYTGDGDNYVEAGAGSGTSDDPLSLIGGQSRSGTRSLSVVRYITPQWGFKLGATWARVGAGGSERGVSASLYRRW